MNKTCVSATHPAQIKVLLCLDNRFWEHRHRLQGPGRPQDQQRHHTPCSPHPASLSESNRLFKFPPTTLKKNPNIAMFWFLSVFVCLGLCVCVP